MMIRPLFNRVSIWLSINEMSGNSPIWSTRRTYCPIIKHVCVVIQHITELMFFLFGEGGSSSLYMPKNFFTCFRMYIPTRLSLPFFPLAYINFLLFILAMEANSIAHMYVCGWDGGC